MTKYRRTWVALVAVVMSVTLGGAPAGASEQRLLDESDIVVLTHGTWVAGSMYYDCAESGPLLQMTCSLTGNMDLVGTHFQAPCTEETVVTAGTPIGLEGCSAGLSGTVTGRGTKVSGATVLCTGTGSGSVSFSSTLGISGSAPVTISLENGSGKAVGFKADTSPPGLLYLTESAWAGACLALDEDDEQVFAGAWNGDFTIVL